MHQTSSIINVLNVNTIKQIVDMLTKTLHGDCFAKLHKLLGIITLPINGCHFNLGTLHVHTLLVATCHKVKLTYFMGESVVSTK